ncbi:hypothetical protein CZP2022_6 [Vibrio phage C-ZP2022]|nr:hypothetical protein CZP2022_6 [Vibrio phage C-ZP2022]
MEAQVYIIAGLVFAFLIACCVARYYWAQAKETQITNDGLVLELSNVGIELDAIKTDLTQVHKSALELQAERQKLKARLPRVLGKEKAAQFVREYPKLFK